MSLQRISLMSFFALAGACGAVPQDEPDASSDSQPLPGTTTYKGTVQASMAAPFGGVEDYCSYTMTLRQIELELKISTTGVVTGGSAQNLTEEKIVGTCQYAPAGPTIQKFTFKSATPVGATTMVVMEGAVTNAPKASLGITLTQSSGAFQAAARWTRTDQVPQLTWTVTSNVTLTVQ
jgi:hypothetical protein